MQEVLVNGFIGQQGLPRKSVVRLIDSPDMTINVYRGFKMTTQLNVILYLFLTLFRPDTHFGVFS